MSTYANQILHSLKEHNKTQPQELKKVASESESKNTAKGLTHMEKHAFIGGALGGMLGGTLGKVLGLGALGAGSYMLGQNANRVGSGLRGAFQGFRQGYQQPMMNNRFNAGPYPYGGYGGGYGGGPRGNRQAAKYHRRQAQMMNPRNFNPRGNFIQNKEKRVAWRNAQKDFNQNWKNRNKTSPVTPSDFGPNPAPAAPAAPAGGVLAAK